MTSFLFPGKLLHVNIDKNQKLPKNLIFVILMILGKQGNSMLNERQRKIINILYDSNMIQIWF